MASLDVASAHANIVNRAVQIANANVPSYRQALQDQGMEEGLLRKIAQFVGVGNYFKPKPQHLDNPSLGLTVDYNFDGIEDLEARQTIRKTFRKIAEDALTQAVKENTGSIRTAVIAEARAGKNYFDLFKAQKKLFEPDVIPTKPKISKPRSVKTIDDPNGEQGQLF
jgi:hypothetical protein